MNEPARVGPPWRLPARTLWALLALLGASAGHAVAVASGQAAAELGPTGWTLAPAPTRYVDPSLLGELGVSPRAWPLVQYRTLTSPPLTELAFTLTLPAQGSLDVSTGQATLRLRSGARPAGAGVCEGALPVVGTTPYPLRLRAAPDALEASSQGQTMRCRVASGAAFVLTPGLHRLWLSDLRAGGASSSPLTAAGHGLLLIVGAAILVAIGAASVASGGSLGTAVLVSLPLLACAVLAGADLSGLREVVRLPSLPTRWAPLAAGVVPSALGHAGALARRWAATSPRTRVTVAVVLAAIGLVSGREGSVYGLAVVGLVAVGWLLARRIAGAEAAAGAPAVLALGAAVGAALVFTSNPAARMYLALAGGMVGGLVWLTVSGARVWLYNVVSLGCALLALAYLEMGVRFTDAGRFWTAAPVDSAGWSSSVESFVALESATSTHYPSSGFPIRLPPKAAPRRVVCLGGSSTGGAWQDDDLGVFYPARLDAALGAGVEAVNQGVGAWSTFHIAIFAARHLVELNPDVVTLYVGVNEGTTSAMTYVELHRRWKAGTLSAGPGRLEQLRLFNGLRFLVRGLSANPLDRAVPAADFADNLASIAASTRQAGAKLLLLSEAMQPDPISIAEYRAAMGAAVGSDVAYLDTAGVVTNPAWFRDTNHLTPAGHDALAGLIAAELRRLGWIN
ncbi:MAG: SGNH/GDSL hydrolase family protein [Myxococcales bacterium]|nr:SGNH/GDSL hydrolase family protein [Myxococcales bacterium]